jgi:hypothetical protein
VEQIKKQLEYREENRKELANFNPTRSISSYDQVLIEERGGVPYRFVVSDAKDWRKENPDIVLFKDVSDIKFDVRKFEHELTYKDEDGVDHTITLAKPIKRHTPDRFLNTYLLSQFMDQVNSSVLSGVYNKELLDAGNFEYVDFWQAMDNPDEIIVQPNVLNEHGVCAKAEEAVAQAGVLGILFDDEAIGITVMNEGVRSIENPRGRYFNDFHNFLIRYYNDQTENSMVILLD